VRAAPELLGAPTIGRGSAQPEGGGEGSPRSQRSLPSHPKYTKTAEKMGGGFTYFLAYKLPKTQFFVQKYLTRYISETFFEEYINFKIFTT
jgi:hypothetical protein